MNALPYAALRQECLDSNLRLPKTGLVDLTFGNVSVSDGSVFAIKPSGVPYEKMCVSDIVVLDFDGNILAGSMRPSSDTPTHRCLYRKFAERGVLAIVHTHSRAATAFAQAARDIPCLGTTHCDHFDGPVPVTRALIPDEIAGEYEWEIGGAIIERLAELSHAPLDMPAVLVRNHGPFAWGATGIEAVENAHALEIVADMAWRTLLLDPHATVAPDYLRQKHFCRKHGSTATYGQ